MRTATVRVYRHIEFPVASRGRHASKTIATYYARHRSISGILIAGCQPHECR